MWAKILLFFCLTFSLFAHENFTIDEFLALHPDEKVKMERFNTLVQKAPTPLNQEQKQPVKITIIYPSGQLSDYWRRNKIAFEKRLQVLGIDYALQSYFIELSNIQEQSRKIKEAFKAKTDYLIFTLNLDAHKKIISQVLSREKPKVIMQNITTPLKEWEGSQPFLYVGFDHIQGTKLLAKYFKKRFQKEADYGLLYFKKGYISHMRGDSFKSMMLKDFKLLASFYTDGKASKSYKATKKLLQDHPNIDFIYACSTDVSIGAIKAMEALDKNPIINGWGGGSFELELLKNKRLDVTVMRINDDSAIAMAEAIKLDLQGDDKSIPQIYSGNFVLIDQNTTKDEILKFSKRAFRYSGFNE